MYELTTIESMTYHHSMLTDRMRTKSFLRAILKTVKPGDVVDVKFRYWPDFDEQQMADRFNKKAIVEAAVMELIYYGKKYKHWLLAAINIENADYIAEVLNNSGIKAVSIHSKTKDVDSKIEDFKKGKYRAAVQVNMLSTGFDFPKIDLIGDLRPTQSPILHVQF